MGSIIAPIVLAVVLLLIILRQRLGNLSPWKSMLAGALMVLALGAIDSKQALGSIDWGVMLFLYGMMVLGHGMEESGYLQHLGYKIMKRARQPHELLLVVVFMFGIGSALLLNDTLALIGTPICILLAHKSGVLARPLLIALALAVTVGSVLSPIGNPQNFLIASRPELGNPFASFLVYLAVPTILTLAALAGLLWWRFSELKRLRAVEDIDRKGKPDYEAARGGLGIVVILSCARLLSLLVPLIPHFDLYWIALAGAGTYVLLSQRPQNALNTDWETLAFFLGMFILTQAVWMSGFFQSLLPAGSQLGDQNVIVASSLLLSQVLSNVPFVIFYLKAMGTAAQVPSLMLLAMASTMAGALTIIGAASNIIIIQSARKRCEDLPAGDFMLIGFAITAVEIALTLGWMAFLKAIGFA